MTGRLTLVGAGELMAAMSGEHRAVLNRLNGPARPVFFDTTAGFETNIDAIVAKAVEYYRHHLQTDLRVASYRHRDRASATELAAAIAEIRAANLIFAGPGSPSYAIKQWRESPVWDAVVLQFENGVDVLFASAASITLGSHALPVYEIYKAGEDPEWIEGLDLLGNLGLRLAVVPHFNDNSGGDNYDSRFCYMGAKRFDLLQEVLPADVSILGIDAYTSVSFDSSAHEAEVSGQGGITLIGEGAERRFEAGVKIPFSEFNSSSREVVRKATEERVFGYEFNDNEDEEVEETDVLAPVLEYLEEIEGLSQEAKLEVMTRLQALRGQIADSASSSSAEAPLMDLVLELRQALRVEKRFDLADKARLILDGLGFEVGDTPGGATWTRR